MKIKGFIVDLDGTVYLGDALIPGSAETIAWMRRRGRVIFLSNKPTDSPAAYAAKLCGLGVPTEDEEVITSVAIAIQYLRENRPGARFHLIGESFVESRLLDAGLIVGRTPDETDIVVVSLDRGLTYAKLHHAYLAARAGAEVYATNPDLVCPTDRGGIIDAGASIAALEALMGRPVDKVFGKPSPEMAHAARRLAGSTTEETLVIGDRVETDIAMGIEAGMRTALVLSGATDSQSVERASFRPDVTVSSLADLPQALGEG